MVNHSRAESLLFHQADWLAARFAAEVLGGGESAALAASASAVVMLKTEGIDVVSVGNTAADPWDLSVDDHAAGCAPAPLRVSQWADQGAGCYVKMVTCDDILEGFVCVGMPRTAAELTLLFERGSELPADRLVLLRYDGPDYKPEAGSAFARDVTVCWCNAVMGGAIADSAEVGNTPSPASVRRLGLAPDAAAAKCAFGTFSSGSPRLRPNRRPDDDRLAETLRPEKIRSFTRFC